MSCGGGGGRRKEVGERRERETLGHDVGGGIQVWVGIYERDRTDKSAGGRRRPSSPREPDF